MGSAAACVVHSILNRAAERRHPSSSCSRCSLFSAPWPALPQDEKEHTAELEAAAAELEGRLASATEAAEKQNVGGGRGRVPGGGWPGGGCVGGCSVFFCRAVAPPPFNPPNAYTEREGAVMVPQKDR